MNTLECNAECLPTLRPDVEFHAGPTDSDGAPTYVIHDPLAATFEKANWVQASILELLRVPSTIGSILDQLAANSTIRVSPEDVRRLCNDASARGLTTDSRGADMRRLRSERASFRHGALETLFRKLIYVRVPLFRPDAFLDGTVGMTRHLARPAALAAYLCISMIGLILFVQHFDAYLSTFPYFFNLRGILGFTCVIVVVKVIHELSHAYVAKAMGVRVPRMGIALILLFPLAYCDVTDSWRMKSRRKRMLIALAGVVSELVIAGLALFAWTISPPGIVKSICFMLSSVTLLSTLLINLNPVMRFDGYYVLCDLVGIDNLQSRSFALARGVFRHYALGMAISSPEVRCSKRRLLGMTTYAVLSWAYRLFIYSGIALILYHTLTKVLGSLVFAMGIYTFIVRPIAREGVDLVKARRHLRWNPRIVITTACCALVLLWAALPLPRSVAVPAVTAPVVSQSIYTPCEGVVRELGIGLGSSVRNGQVLFVIESDVLERRSRLARLEVQRIETELALIKGDDRRRALLPQKTDALARAVAELEKIRATMQRNRIEADLDGVVVEWAESIRNGTHVGVGQKLGRLIDHRQAMAVAYVRQDLVSDLAVNKGVSFRANADARRIEGVITNIAPTRTTFLLHDGLASTAGGDIAVMPDDLGRLEVMDSYYEVEVALEKSSHALRLGQTGRIWIRTAPRSHLVTLMRHLYRVLIRESGV